MIMPYESVGRNAQEKVTLPVSEMQLYKLRSWAEGNPTFKRAFKRRWDITGAFIDELERKRDSSIPQHNILEINGDTGSGKSTVAMALAVRHLTNGHKHVHICMEISSFLELAKNAKRGDCIIRDEQPLRVGLGSTRENMQLINLGEITRKYQLNLLFVSPSQRGMVMPHYRLFTMWMDQTKRENRLAVLDPMRNICLGHVTVPMLKKNPLLQQYEKQKDQFIESTKEGRMSNDLLMKYAREMIDNLKYNEIKKNNLRVAFIRHHFPMLTTGEIKQILHNVEMLQKGIL